MKNLMIVAAAVALLSTSAFAGPYDSEKGTQAYDMTNAQMLAHSKRESGYTSATSGTMPDRSAKMTNEVMVRENLRDCCNGKMPAY